MENPVPAERFYHHLNAKLELSFVRAWVQDSNAAGGRPSIDPMVFFKRQSVRFCEGLRSERRRMETVPLDLVHRWYLGYRLDEAMPDHSSLTQIRTRLGLALFQRFFTRVVACCQEAGHVLRG